MAQSQALQSQEKKELVSKDETTVPVRYFVPTTDIFEIEDALTVVMEVPGVNKDAVDISVENQVLKIEAKIDPSKYDGMEPLYTEYNVGHFARSFTLSNKIDQQQISAKLEDGVLTLTLKKAEEAVPRKSSVG
jgi:HSP20 family protein